MTETTDPILEACLGVNGAITADLVVDILQETNPRVSMPVLKSVHIRLMDLCRTGELIRISEPGDKAVYLRVADATIVPQTTEIVPPVAETVPFQPETGTMPDMVRAAILYMRQLYPFVTTVFYSRDRQWIFTGDDMRVAEIMDKIVEGLDLDLLREAGLSVPVTPAAYRLCEGS